MDAKLCSDCKAVKPVTEFYQQKRYGPYRSRCKACEYARWKMWIARPQNRRKKCAWLKRYFLQHHDEHLRKMREYHRIYYLKNKEKLATKHRAYATSPRGKEVCREGVKRWLARKRGATPVPFLLTLEQWKLILAEFDNACAWCGAVFSDYNRPEQDHIIPVSRGGAHSTDNVVPACRSCNARWGNGPKPLPASWLAFNRDKST